MNRFEELRSSYSVFRYERFEIEKAPSPLPLDFIFPCRLT